jgi:hypothetical protein
VMHVQVQCNSFWIVYVDHNPSMTLIFCWLNIMCFLFMAFKGYVPFSCQILMSHVVSCNDY